MGVIADRHGIAYDMVAFEETMQVDPEVVEKNLSRHGDVTHVAFVHCETTTGILNPLPELARVVKAHGKKLIVDAMSSFGGVPHQQCEQMYPGRARFRLYHRPPQ